VTCVTVSVFCYLVAELKETYHCPATVVHVNVVGLLTCSRGFRVGVLQRTCHQGRKNAVPKRRLFFRCVNIGLVLMYTDDVNLAAKLYCMGYLRLDK
jgi:hypothetical protein